MFLTAQNGAAQVSIASVVTSTGSVVKRGAELSSLSLLFHWFVAHLLHRPTPPLSIPPSDAVIEAAAREADTCTLAE